MSGFLYAKLKCTATAERGNIIKYGKIKRYRGKVKRFKAKLKSVRAKCDCIALGYYLDDGYSGTTFDRPAFREMEAMAENGEIGTIVVKDLSRFGRNYLEVGQYLEIKYPTLGIRFIAIQDNVDSESNTGTELMPFSNIFNEWHAASTSKKVRAVWASKAAQGKRVGTTVPYGYVKDAKDMEIWHVDPEAADVVKRIYALSLSGT